MRVPGYGIEHIRYARPSGDSVSQILKIMSFIKIEKGKVSIMQTLNKKR